MQPEHSKKKISEDELPEDFTADVTETVFRIDGNIHVIGVMYIKNNQIEMSTVQETLGMALCSKVPKMTTLMRNAIAEINVLDELVAFRLITKTNELLVAPVENRLACVFLKTRKRRRKA